MIKFIAGDIGGTNSRLSLCSIPDVALSYEPNIIFRHDFESKKYDRFSLILKDFIDILIQKKYIKKEYSDEIFIAVLAVAGPVGSDSSVKFTNLSWPKFSPESLKEEFKIKYIHIQNDFKSVGYGILHCNESDLITVNKGTKIRNKVICAIGAGTGLGHCFLTFDDNGDRYVHSSEGGHLDFPIQSKEDWELAIFTKNKLGLEEHLSTERLCSGNGIEIIYEYYRKRFDFNEEKEFQDFRNNNKCLAPLVTKYLFSCETFEEQKSLCKMTIKKFIEIYANFSASISLCLMPKGGLFITGGIIAKIIKMADKTNLDWIIENFREYYFKKGRMNDLINNFPVKFIKNENIGILGATHVAVRYLNIIYKDRK